MDRELVASMRLSENESEGNNEELVAEVVADVQNPVTPSLVTARLGEGLHELGGMIPRLGKIIHHGAAAIDENLIRVGAMEINLGHVRPPLNGMDSNATHASQVSSSRRRDDDRADALRIWTTSKRL
ncbi:hypothetical protein [Bradyrhizobium erythrophlei]|uniref:hypothetical protein n=1 Tax=Bradyrhizobium erythrophlei TaxID=1437360 RepID=UPI00406BD92C